MPAPPYDVIVLGAGGVGTAAMWQLAARGLRVLGIDRFDPPHSHGSSHGRTRIIRQAYFEHTDYVPLLLESYRLWEELEHQTGEQLKLETGLLEVGPADGIVVPGVLAAARQHQLSVEELTAAEIANRWPAFRMPPSSDVTGVFEPRAGLLFVEQCVAACLAEAKRHGAELLTNVEVIDWNADAAAGIVVRTTAGEFRANRLVITAGAWAGSLLQSLGVPLEVRRKPLMWYDSTAPAQTAASAFPCFLFELSHAVFYGFPAVDEQGVKVAEHSGGEPIADPLQVDRQLRASDTPLVDQFVRDFIPSLQTPCRDHAVCLYTMSPDEHFIVDRHPADPRVVFAAGLSGHGFKFTPVLGEALAELATEGVTRQPTAFLSLERFRRS
ncbi:N-methyl-L-tryptophan oxidase [Lacipirellula sp.]|uniref:N-methyl-L-tryptophan oxidase n=1 Tax=Lacipirellula sp. TaxID=2691419 RepID=UPI003D0B217B